MGAISFVDSCLKYQAEARAYITERVKEYVAKQFPGVTVREVVLKTPGNPVKVTRLDNGLMHIEDEINIKEDGDFINPAFLHVFILVDDGMIGLIETFVVKPDANMESDIIVNGLPDGKDGSYIDGHGLWLDETDMWIYANNGMRFRID